MNTSSRLCNEVTLSAVVGHPAAFESTLKAVLYSSKDIDFKNIQILSCIPFNIPNIKYIEIPQMSYGNYNDFIIKDYNKYINTNYVLHVQDDGFILNPSAWTDLFLDYDYIGALWTVISPDTLYGVNESNRVGNGGFTLRSKKFLNISEQYCPTHNGLNEDVVVCRVYRDIFLSHGINYAPNDLAAKFSIEDDQASEYIGQSHKNYRTIKTFGFHRKGSDATNLLNNIQVSNYI